MKSGGVKRFSKMFSQTFDTMDQVLFNHLQPACQSLFLLLSQLESMVSWKERMDAVGISAGGLAQAKKTAGQLILRVEALSRQLATHRTQYPPQITHIGDLVLILLIFPNCRALP